MQWDSRFSLDSVQPVGDNLLDDDAGYAAPDHRMVLNSVSSGSSGYASDLNRQVSLVSNEPENNVVDSVNGPFDDSEDDNDRPVDGMVFYAAHDYDDAEKWIEDIRNNVELKNGKPPEFRLFEVNYGKSKFHELDKAMRRSTYWLFYLTSEPDPFILKARDECLEEALSNEDRRWSIIPIFTAPKKKLSVPSGLKSIAGINAVSTNINSVYSKMEKAFNERLNERLEREERWRTEKVETQMAKAKMKKMDEILEREKAKSKREDELREKQIEFEKEMNKAKRKRAQMEDVRKEERHREQQKLAANPVIGSSPMSDILPRDTQWDRVSDQLNRGHADVRGGNNQSSQCHANGASDTSCTGERDVPESPLHGLLRAIEPAVKDGGNLTVNIENLQIGNNNQVMKTSCGDTAGDRDGDEDVVYVRKDTSHDPRAANSQEASEQTLVISSVHKVDSDGIDDACITSVKSTMSSGVVANVAGAEASLSPGLTTCTEQKVLSPREEHENTAYVESLKMIQTKSVPDIDVGDPKSSKSCNSAVSSPFMDGMSTQGGTSNEGTSVKGLCLSGSGSADIADGGADVQRETPSHYICQADEDPANQAEMMAQKLGNYELPVKVRYAGVNKESGTPQSLTFTRASVEEGSPSLPSSAFPTVIDAHGEQDTSEPLRIPGNADESLQRHTACSYDIGCSSSEASGRGEESNVNCESSTTWYRTLDDASDLNGSMSPGQTARSEQTEKQCLDPLSHKRQYLTTEGTPAETEPGSDVVEDSRSKTNGGGKKCAIM